jgi:hypothetical protein
MAAGLEGRVTAIAPMPQISRAAAGGLMIRACDCAGRFVGDGGLKLFSGVRAVCETCEIGAMDRILADASEGRESEVMSTFQKPPEARRAK